MFFIDPFRSTFNAKTLKGIAISTCNHQTIHIMQPCQDPQNGTRAGSFRTGAKGTICTPSSEMSLNCSETATDATRICFCKGTEELYKLAPRGEEWGWGRMMGWLGSNFCWPWIFFPCVFFFPLYVFF